LQGAFFLVAVSILPTGTGHPIQSKFKLVSSLDTDLIIFSKTTAQGLWHYGASSKNCTTTYTQLVSKITQIRNNTSSPPPHMLANTPT
jgi:hypothetical protein